MSSAPKKAVTRALHRLRRVSTVQPVEPGPWVQQAACQGHGGDAWMDDHPGVPTAHAIAVCAACPVQAACLAHALAHDEPWGVWGGLTTRERIALHLVTPGQR